MMKVNGCVSACNCNGYSDRCFFDKELYAATGRGGHCQDCRDNRDGANCERCRENYYARPEDGYCIACQCNEIGESECPRRTWLRYRDVRGIVAAGYDALRKIC